MALIRGSRGLIYFVHQFKPVFKEAALLDDPEMLAAVTSINAEIRELAPVLNAPTLLGKVTVQPDAAQQQIATMVKRKGDSDYLFTVNLANKAAEATFSLNFDFNPKAIEVRGESREIAMNSASFTDAFGPYEVHLYRVKRPAKPAGEN
jgi:hypothetical protein